MAHVGRVVANLGQGQVFRFYRTSLFNHFVVSDVSQSAQASSWTRGLRLWAWEVE
jgi:hypothetical protein